MSIVKRSADLVYAFRFVRLLTTRWEDTEAYNLGIIDKNGTALKKVSSLSSQEKKHYTAFIRLVFNMKRILEKTPGAGRLASFASALYLIKEHGDLSDKAMTYIFEKSGLSVDELLVEDSRWFIVDGDRISPGIYKIRENKVLNEGYEPYVRALDRVRVIDGKPIAEMFGVKIYEAIHVNTRKKIYVSATELMK